MSKITKKDFIKEFTKGQRMYEIDNKTGSISHMDLQTYMWNMYETHIEHLREKQAMWSPEVLSEFLNAKPKKAVIKIKKKRQ